MFAADPQLRARATVSADGTHCSIVELQIEYEMFSGSARTQCMLLRLPHYATCVSAYNGEACIQHNEKHGQYITDVKRRPRLRLQTSS
jgi:hypothetical protein